MRKYVVLIAALAVVGWGCKKDEVSEPNPTIPDTPEIEVTAVTPSSIQQFQDLTFTINYTDGNGDLGSPDADDAVVFITDNRAGIQHEFHVPPLAPAGETIAIQGNLLVVLEGVILLDQNSSSESATFTVQIKDQAGNFSNSVTTSSVTITQ